MRIETIIGLSSATEVQELDSWMTDAGVGVCMVVGKSLAVAYTPAEAIPIAIVLRDFANREQVS